jgi:protein BCP1
MADSNPSSKRAKSAEDHEGSETEEDELALDAQPHRPDNSDDDDDSDDDDTIHIDFRLFDPQEVDFLSLKRLVKGLLPGNDARFAAGSSSLASAIIAQPDVGTMVKVGEDVDVWAFVTLLAWEAHKGTDFVKEMQRFLLNKCPDAGKEGDLKSELASYFDGSKGRLSLLLSERMMNFPPELAPSIYASLVQDRQWAQDQCQAAGETDAAAQLRPDWLLCLAPCARELSSGDSSETVLQIARRRK